MTSTVSLFITAENVWYHVSVALEDDSLLSLIKMHFKEFASTYPNTEVMEKLAADELVWVVVLIRWEQFT